LFRGARARALFIIINFGKLGDGFKVHTEDLGLTSTGFNGSA